MDSLVSSQEFNSALWARFKEGKIRNVYPKAKYDHIIKKIKFMTNTPPVNAPGEYYLFRKFVIAKVGVDERLACKDLYSGAKNGFLNVNDVKFYVALEEIYDFIDDAHNLTNHGGKDRIARALQEQGVMNIARDTIELFLSFCPVCRPRQKEPLRKTAAQIIGSVQTENSYDSMTDESESVKNPTVILKDISLMSKTELAEVCSTINPVPNFRRGHIAILDLTASPDGEFRFILLYMDYQTLFTVLKPVKCKCTYEISSHLLEIFTLLGAPQILHSDYDSPFLSTVIQELKRSWPECVIVVSRDNTHVEQAKQCISEVEQMLRDWISDNTSYHWSYGLKFVQMKKNNAVSNGKKSSYEQFFGRPLENVPSYLSSSLQTEDELRNVINKHKVQPEQLQVALDPNVCSMVQNNFLDEIATDSTDLFQEELIIDTSIVKSEPLEEDDELHTD